MNTSVQDAEYQQVQSGEVIEGRSGRRCRLRDDAARLDALRRASAAIYDPQWMNDDHYFSRLHSQNGGMPS